MRGQFPGHVIPLGQWGYLVILYLIMWSCIMIVLWLWSSDRRVVATIVNPGASGRVNSGIRSPEGEIFCYSFLLTLQWCFLFLLSKTCMIFGTFKKASFSKCCCFVVLSGWFPLLTITVFSCATEIWLRPNIDPSSHHTTDLEDNARECGHKYQSIRGQYLGHEITRDQSEASIQVKMSQKNHFALAQRQGQISVSCIQCYYYWPVIWLRFSYSILDPNLTTYLIYE